MQINVIKPTSSMPSLSLTATNTAGSVQVASQMEIETDQKDFAFDDTEVNGLSQRANQLSFGSGMTVDSFVWCVNCLTRVIWCVVCVCVSCLYKVDEDDAGDAQMVSEYIADIHAYFKRTEAR